MKASQFTDVQKALIIKQGEDGTPVAEICRKAGISQATYFKWKKKHADGVQAHHGGIEDWRRLKGENRLPMVIAGIKFTDGVANPASADQRAA